MCAAPGLLYDLVDAKSGDVIAEAGKKVTPRAVKQLIDDGKVTDLLVPYEQIAAANTSPRTSSTKKPAPSTLEAGDELTIEYDKDGDIIRRHRAKN